jgi:hypothetical protein
LGISRPFPSQLAAKAGATLGYGVRECIKRVGDTGAVRCALLITLAWLAFFGLFLAAAQLYPGGTWLDRSAQGHHFFANYFCDLTQPTSLSGVKNALGSRFAQLSMLCFGLALSGFFWLVPSYFGRPTWLGAWVRGLGECAVLGYVAVPLTPSELFGDLHASLSLISGAIGIAAALGAVVGLLGSHRAARALGVVGVLSLFAGGMHAALFVHYLHASEPAPLIVPAIQKVAAALLSAWMLGLAWLTLTPSGVTKRVSRRREIDR